MNDDSIQKRLYERFVGSPGSNALAFVDDSENVSWRNFGEVYESARERAAVFASHGIGQGDVCILIPENDEFSTTSLDPLVTRDVDNRFTTVLIVDANSPAQSLQDLKDKSFAFGSRLSTSAHYMPRYFLNERNIEPEKFFQDVQYTGSHDKTVYTVRDGKVYAGAVNAVIYKKMLADGRLEKGRVKVLWETPPYQDYAWAISVRMPEAHKISIQDAFLGLSLDDPEHKKILEILGANHFLPLSMKDFIKLQSALNKVESSQE